MGLLSSITGNAGEVSAEQAMQIIGPLLLDGETILQAYQVGRDYIIFTPRRLVLVDKQGMTGSKLEFRTIPYRSITNYSIETAGNWDLDAEMKIHITGQALPITKEFNKKVNVYAVERLLAQMVTGGASGPALTPPQTQTS